MRFCDICESRLVDVITFANMYYKCTGCEKKYDTRPNDTLKHKVIFERKESKPKYGTVLKNAAFDHVNPRIRKECPKM